MRLLIDRAFLIKSASGMAAAFLLVLFAEPLIAQAKKRPEDLPVKTNSIGMKFRLLPSGTFMMGSEVGSDNERPQHKVTLTRSFELGVYEVTQAEYEEVMEANPSKFKNPQNPVEMVRWDDAVEFCRKLSELPEEKAAGYVYRLPTEAEWEYACRAGTNTKYSFGNDEKATYQTRLVWGQ